MKITPTDIMMWKKVIKIATDLNLDVETQEFSEFFFLIKRNEDSFDIFLGKFENLNDLYYFLLGYNCIAKKSTNNGE